MMKMSVHFGQASSSPGGTGWVTAAARTLVAAIVVAAWLTAAPSAAQSDLSDDLGVLPNLSLGDLGDDADDQPVKLSAQLDRQGESRAVLRVVAQLQPNWYIYSVTQPTGGPLRTTIQLTGPDGVELDGDFQPDTPPQVGREQAWPDVRIEKHFGQVRWEAPLQLPTGRAESISLQLRFQVCSTEDGRCVPYNEQLTAKFQDDREPTGVEAAAADMPAAESAAAEAGSPQVRDDGDEADGVTRFSEQRYVVQWTGRIHPAEVPAGGQAVLRFTATPEESYHVYAAAVDDTASRTNFVVTDKAGLKLGQPEPNEPPIVQQVVASLPEQHYHEGEVTWSIPVQVAADASPGQRRLSGYIGYQACTDTSCLPPKALRFTVLLDVVPSGQESTDGRLVRFASASFPEVMDTAAETRWVDPVAAGPADQAAAPAGTPQDQPLAAVPSESRQDTAAAIPGSLAMILLMALAGGMILNLMPCVLPVVGLKIMSFTSQAGEDRQRILALNVAYTIGILVVFWALAVLAVISTYSWGQAWLRLDGQMSWGQQFQFFEFRYGVILVVFALALSFLGVWEIPLPGFVGGKSTQQLQQKEGFSGAFFKGVFTTILATPCSGPLLGAVFAYTLGKSALVIMAIFTSIGLGMALPYLLVAMFPRLIAFLPKPGEWMDVLKQLLGFVLLATVVFVFTFFPNEDRVLVFMSLIGVWFGCWIIGLVPSWQTLAKRLSAWAGGIAATAAVCVSAFWITAAGPEVLAWEPYNEARLQQLQRQGRTVLVDFTAQWCLTCKMNYQVAINTRKTAELVERLDAVAMLADWTDFDDSIQEKLHELGSNSIPLLAIYPGQHPDQPIVLRDTVTQGEVLAALEQAGPSLGGGRSLASQERESGATATMAR